jgi:hypothetical protein
LKLERSQLVRWRTAKSGIKNTGGVSMDEYYKYKEKFTPELIELIKEMERNGIKFSGEQSDILKREYGIDIPPHFISEYKYRKRFE